MTAFLMKVENYENIKGFLIANILNYDCAVFGSGNPSNIGW